jgi:tetratricopeptide (TPR) repeat protein
MRIPLALLADHALAHPTDGKLYVTGGGIRSLSFPGFPATYAHLSLAVGIEVDKAELSAEHTLLIRASGPTEDPIFRPVQVRFRLPSAATAGDSGRIHFVSNMDNISFPSAGRYEFRITIDEKPLEVVALEVEKGKSESEDSEGTAQREAQILVAAGYRAFGEGNTLQAEEFFRSAIGRAPTLPSAHNNLGFVLLAKGDAEGALVALAEARRLGYPQNEISDANIGCALYRAGKSGAALKVFVDCLETHIFRGPATLFGIGSADLFPVHLESAAGYVALIALNAAWSAARAGDIEAKIRYEGLARAGELSLPETARAVFSTSVEDLSSL